MTKEPAKSFQDLIVWQKAHRFVLEIYRFTNSFPKSETYGLISQLRRAAVSVPANMGEGGDRSQESGDRRVHQIGIETRIQKQTTYKRWRMKIPVTLIGKPVSSWGFSNWARRKSGKRNVYQRILTPDSWLLTPYPEGG
ncbi:MAG: four helix bundle protein [Crocosphaera sp.]|nr:four helix bundle protein [Crocosphaera sp.]